MLVIFTLDIILTLAHVASYVKGTQVYQKEEKYYFQRGFFCQSQLQINGIAKEAIMCFYNSSVWYLAS